LIRTFFLAIATLTLVGLVFISLNRGAKKQLATPEQKKQQAATPQQKNQTSFSRPTVPPPHFRVYRSKLDEFTSVVVPPDTTDEQLRSLLWLFREKVRSHQFKDIGITQPTSTHWGNKGYMSGGILVYRGGKCANEDFTDSPVPGPCGTGDHDAAYYQWGLLVDGVFDWNADCGSITSAHGKTIIIFDYRDHWQPQPRAEGDKNQPPAEQPGKPPRDLLGWENTRWGMTEKEVRAALTIPFSTPRSEAEQPSDEKWYMPFLIRDFGIQRSLFEVRFLFDRQSKKLDVVIVELRGDVYRLSDVRYQTRMFDWMIALATERYGKASSVRDWSETGVYNKEVVWKFPSTVLAIHRFGEGNFAKLVFVY
jgi:hypothetical protein